MNLSGNFVEKDSVCILKKKVHWLFINSLPKAWVPQWWYLLVPSLAWRAKDAFVSLLFMDLAWLWIFNNDPTDPPHTAEAERFGPTVWSFSARGGEGYTEGASSWPLPCPLNEQIAEKVHTALGITVKPDTACNLMIVAGNMLVGNVSLVHTSHCWVAAVKGKW